MDKADTFKNLVEGGDSLDCYGEFSFRTVFFKSSYSYRCCPCAFQHEYFLYLSDEGNTVDQQMYENIVKNVRNSECNHVKNAPKECIKETSVQKHHVYIAVHTDFNPETFFGSKNTFLKSTTGLFQLTEYELAVQKINKSLVEYVAYSPSDFAVCTKHNIFLNTNNQYKYDPMMLTMICDESKIKIKITKVSLLAYCIKLQNKELFENVLRIFNPLMIDRYKISSALHTAYELVFRNNHEEMLHVLKKRDYEIVSEKRSHMGKHEGPNLTEYAVVYNQPGILDQTLEHMRFNRYKLSPEYKQKLVEICFVLKHNNCKVVLAKHGIPAAEQSWQLDVANQIHRLLYLYKNYHYFRDKIRSRLQSMNNIQENINIPRKIYNFRVTHLQWYIAGCDADLDVIKLLLQLGAHVEGPEVEPGTGLIYERPLLHILDKAKPFTGYLRPLLELLLFANPSTALDNKEDCLGLSLDAEDYLAGNRIEYSEMLPGVYMTDNEQHAIYEGSDFTNPALRFVVPQLIESGFNFPKDTLEEALEDFMLHPDEIMYIETCLENPRKLTKCCRDVLRRCFPGNQIHKFVRAVKIPKRIGDFILLRRILPSVASLEL